MGEVTLDGYVRDREGRFDWVMPGADLHLHAGAELANAGTVVYGRKMYETMVFWETVNDSSDMPAAFKDFAKSWQAPQKVVVSRSLTTPTSERTRIVNDLSADDMRKLKAQSEKPLTIAG